MCIYTHLVKLTKLFLSKRKEKKNSEHRQVGCSVTPKALAGVMAAILKNNFKCDLTVSGSINAKIAFWINKKGRGNICALQ